MAAQVPNAALMSQAMATMSTEFAKLDNIPAFNQGAAILHALEQINQRMERVEQRMERMEQRIGQMEQRINQRFDHLEARIRALDQNSVARTQNSMRGFSDQELIPLVNSSTAENIPNFPTTPAILNRATSVVLNDILIALGLGTNGTMEEKRVRLRIAIGLKA